MWGFCQPSFTEARDEVKRPPKINSSMSIVFGAKATWAIPPCLMGVGFVR